MAKSTNYQSGKKITTSEGSVRKDKGTERRETMAIEFRGPTEAFAAVFWVVCTADKLGSMEERDFLYEQVQGLKVFENYGLVEFQNLFGATFNRVFQTLPHDDYSVTKQGVEILIQAFNGVLNPELRVEALKMAVGLANADNLCDEEKTMLEQLQHGLEIDDKGAQDILG